MQRQTLLSDTKEIEERVSSFEQERDSRESTTHTTSQEQCGMRSSVTASCIGISSHCVKGDLLKQEKMERRIGRIFEETPKTSAVAMNARASSCNARLSELIRPGVERGEEERGQEFWRGGTEREV